MADPRPYDPEWIEAERARMADIIARHERIVMQFSGGKDSLASLQMVRDHLEKITVAWANSGDAFPETVELMDAVRARVPYFVEIKADQPSHIAAMGWPVDLLPVSRTPLGRIVNRHNLPIMQGWPVCCGANLWGPMVNFLREFRPTLVILGTKATDERKGLDCDGSIVDGAEVLLPVHKWTHDQVFAFLKREGVEIPEYYTFGTTSLVCRHCTAFVAENSGKMRYMRERHPVDFGEVQRRLREIKRAVSVDNAALDACIIG